MRNAVVCHHDEIWRSSIEVFAPNTRNLCWRRVRLPQNAAQAIGRSLEKRSSSQYWHLVLPYRALTLPGCPVSSHLGQN